MATKKDLEIKCSDHYYTPEQLKLAEDMATEGRTLKDIIEALCTTTSRFYKYKKEHPQFLQDFEQARQEGLEHLADSLVSISDEYVDVQRARLKSENLRWLLSKRKPHIYGDRLDVSISATVDITSALIEAKNRALQPSQIVTINHDMSHIKADVDAENTGCGEVISHLNNEKSGNLKHFQDSVDDGMKMRDSWESENGEE